MSADGQGTKCCRNTAENFNRLSRAHERYRQTTDGRATSYSERERSLKTGKRENHIFTQMDCVTHTLHLCAVFPEEKVVICGVFDSV